MSAFLGERVFQGSRVALWLHVVGERVGLEVLGACDLDALQGITARALGRPVEIWRRDEPAIVRALKGFGCTSGREEGAGHAG